MYPSLIILVLLLPQTFAANVGFAHNAAQRQVTLTSLPVVYFLMGLFTGLLILACVMHYCVWKPRYQRRRNEWSLEGISNDQKTVVMGNDDDDDDDTDDNDLEHGEQSNSMELPVMTILPPVPTLVLPFPTASHHPAATAADVTIAAATKTATKSTGAEEDDAAVIKSPSHQDSPMPLPSIHMDEQKTTAATTTSTTNDY